MTLEWHEDVEPVATIDKQHDCCRRWFQSDSVCIYTILSNFIELSNVIMNSHLSQNHSHSTSEGAP